MKVTAFKDSCFVVSVWHMRRYLRLVRPDPRPGFDLKHDKKRAHMKFEKRKARHNRIVTFLEELVRMTFSEAPSPEEQITIQASPSIISPVGNPLSVAMDDDDDEFMGVSPVPHEPSPGEDRRDGSEWRYFDDDDDSAPPRFRLDSDLHTPLITHTRGPAKLNGLNFLNGLSYVLNVFVSYGIGVWGLGGTLPTRWEVSQEGRTLVTPALWAYWIWAPILAFEALFAIAQLFPHYRARPIIQQGTAFFFFYTCLIQTAWTLFFAFKLYIFSFVSVVAALACMASLLASQHYSQVRGRKSLVEYWLFKFPFYLHTGWLILCSVVQLSMMFRHFSSDVGIQLAADVVALGVMLPVATFFLTGKPNGPDFVIPVVIIWSYVS